jgi:hypothetical protein
MDDGLVRRHLGPRLAHNRAIAHGATSTRRRQTMAPKKKKATKKLHKGKKMEPTKNLFVPIDGKT